MGSSPRAGEGTEGPVDRGSPEMVLWDWHQCSEGMQQTGRSMPASMYRESVTTDIKKKIRIKCAAQGPDTRVFKYHLSGLLPLHSCMCHAHHVHHRGPSSQAHMARLAAGHGTRGTTPGLPLTSQRSTGNIKGPNILPVVSYIQRLHLQIFPVFSLFPQIPVQMLLKRDGQNQVSLLLLTYLPTVCHQQKLNLLLK